MTPWWRGLLSLGLLLAGGQALAQGSLTPLIPSSPHRVLFVEGDPTSLYLIEADRPLQVDCEGPGLVQMTLRRVVYSGDPGVLPTSVKVLLDGQLQPPLTFRRAVEERLRFVDEPRFRPSAPRSSKLAVPNGRHSLVLEVGGGTQGVVVALSLREAGAIARVTGVPMLPDIAPIDQPRRRNPEGRRGRTRRTRAVPPTPVSEPKPAPIEEPEPVAAPEPVAQPAPSPAVEPEPEAVVPPQTEPVASPPPEVEPAAEPAAAPEPVAPRVPEPEPEPEPAAEPELVRDRAGLTASATPVDRGLFGLNNGVQLDLALGVATTFINLGGAAPLVQLGGRYALPWFDGQFSLGLDLSLARYAQRSSGNPAELEASNWILPAMICVGYQLALHPRLHLELGGGAGLALNFATLHYRGRPSDSLGTGAAAELFTELGWRIGPGALFGRAQLDAISASNAIYQRFDYLGGSVLTGYRVQL